MSLKKFNLLTRELSRLMAGNGDKEGMGILSIFQLAYLDLERELGVTWHQYDQFKSILTTRLITPGAQQQSFDAADVKQVVANAEKTVEVLEKADTKFSEAYVALRNHAAELESSLSFESTDFYLNLRYVDFFSLQKFANLCVYLFKRENTKALETKVILRLTKVVYYTLQPTAKEDLKLLDALLTDLEDEHAFVKD